MYCHSLSPGTDRLRRVEPDVGLVTIMWQMLIDGDSSIETSCQHEMFSRILLDCLDSYCVILCWSHQPEGGETHMRNASVGTHMLAQASLERRGQSTTVTRLVQRTPSYHHRHRTFF